MKKSVTFLLVSMLLILSASGQKMTQKAARQIFDRTLMCLNNADTSAFLNMWVFDNAPWPYHQRPFNKRDAIKHYNELRIFLDTALTKKMEIAEIEIERQDTSDKKNYSGSYNIKAWFKYTDKYYKGYGFFVDFVNDTWVLRYAPDYSILRR